MTAWIDPNLLQLVGLGTKDDLYTQDGRHLRWFFGRLLGFPRSGFRLRRTRSPIDPQRWKEIEGAGVGRSQLLSQALVGPFTRRFPNGLTVSKEGALVYTTVPTDGGSYVTIDSKPVRLGFGHEGPSATPPLGPAATNPAAWVRLTIVRKKDSGLASATAYAKGQGTWNYQDSAFVGVGIFATTPGLVVDGMEMGGALARRLGENRIRTLRRTADRPAVARPGLATTQAAATSTWVVETMLLHGGLIERIEIIGRDAVVMRVDWFPTRAYAAADIWTDVDQFFLPLTDEPSIYPAWTTTPGEQVAKDRLFSAPPRALPPWDEPSYPPPPAPPGAVEDDLAMRYLGVGYDRMREAMKIFLGGELSENRPQALIKTEELLEADPPDEEFDGGTTDVYPFELLVGASIDPHVARLLGLLTTDTKEPDGMWDYALDAGFASQWLLWTILEGLSPTPIEKLDELPTSIPGLDKLREQGMRPELVLSVATAIEIAAQPAPEAPADLRADVVPLPAGKPIEAEAGLSWLANLGNFFQSPESVRVFFAARRQDEFGGDEPLHPKDDESGVLLPHVPTRSAIKNGRITLRDRSMPKYGIYTWRLSGMDLWGRFSPFAETTEKVADLIPPPSPASLRAVLAGPDSGAPSWTLRMKFDWGTGSAIAAPDVERFEVHVRQGTVDPSDGENPALWGRTEHVPGATAPPLVVAWPGGTLTAPPGVSASIAVTPIPPEEGGDGTRVTIEIAGVTVPFNAEGLANIAFSARAIDQSGNASTLARPATASRADVAPPAPPPPTGVLRFATQPDALGRSSYRMALNAPPGGTIQVMRCSGAALLGAAAIDDPTFQALDESARVTLLQTLSTQHREVFAMDHEVTYPASATAHTIELNGNDRGWTLATTLGFSRTGIREQWPSDPLRFEVIAVPRSAVPPLPVVVEARGGDRGATLRIRPDWTARSEHFRIYRTRERAATSDVRLMRPVATVPASAAETLFVDSGLFENITYFYRVEALGSGGVRSQPTSAIAVTPYTTAPPPPPEVLGVQKLADPAKRRVEWLLPRRDYGVELLRRPHGVPQWTPAETVASRPDGTLDLTLLTAPTVQDGAWRYTAEDTVPDGAIRWTYRVRITDPQGRVALSPVVEETP
ncbi:MAG TPA: hypothetical protein VEO54_21200 [Thermoanaerobaculia bacterium]|nr:hypothetical protein [Thermoanaerobaculia bacterium]